ncbi:hypothetical protein IT774_13635 [Salinimonas marina]|uniref:PEP-CTERM protein-sorting domain-containing protein n=1 Tax=Salinimonas marina TaxID=2785918 RepID=A0A7S9DWC3_9ALTE|nr:hypothetical protein [Salinimonas marina]QPG05156.1 hypothetical protein IT774_13635 [Salinimonas marina]
MKNTKSVILAVIAGCVVSTPVFAGVPAVDVAEPGMLSLLGAGVAAIYLLKKSRKK